MTVTRIGTSHPLNERSVKNLAGVHPDLVRVVEMAATRCPVPVVVTEGLRKIERQEQLVAAGKSWTLNSRHLTGHAVDLVDADNYAYDIPDLDKIAKAMKECAAEIGVPIVWGGDWKSRDTPHFELDRKAYPASGVPTATRVIEASSKIAKARGVIATAAGAGAVVLDKATGAIGAITDPIIPPVPTGVSETITNLGTWGKLLPAADGRVFLVGALTFAGVALASRFLARLRT